MSNTNTGGIAPLVSGLWLAGTAGVQLLHEGLSGWLLMAFLGGCGAIIVGVGTLFEVGGFGATKPEADQTTLSLFVGIALLCLVGGAAFALL
ncbi:hypothetical protein HacjB3_15486 (plasmid) [Halalkalicoccus jeotgali B3]|nr:hypothetical protein HacjB3_15486 [Halalkalicoccus jeotgali B3]